MLAKIREAFFQSLDHWQELRIKDEIISGIVEHTSSTLKEGKERQTMCQLGCMCEEMGLYLISFHCHLHREKTYLLFEEILTSTS